MCILEDVALDSFRRLISQQAAYSGGDPKMKLTDHDIYKELRLRGYDYGKTFQGILESNKEGITDAFNFFYFSLFLYIVLLMGHCNAYFRRQWEAAVDRKLGDLSGHHVTDDCCWAARS